MRRAGLAIGFAALVLACGESSGPETVSGVAPASLQIVGDSQSGVVATELAKAIVVRVLDSSGRRIKRQVVRFTVTAGGGSISADSGISDDSGTVQTRWTLGQHVVDTQRVDARAVGGRDTVWAQAVASATPLPGPAATFVVSRGDGSVGMASQPLDDSLAVLVNDQFGNAVPGASVTWDVTAGGGSISPATVTTGSGGTAAALWTVGAGGTNTARAQMAGLSALTFSASITQQVAMVTTGEKLSCLLTTAGVPYCTGLDFSGLFKPLSGGLTFSVISAGEGIACGVTLAGAGYCWGANGQGQIGDGTFGNRSVPTAVTGGLTFATITTGAMNTCGLLADGTPYCWGATRQGNKDGTHNDGVNPVNVPTVLPGGLTFSRISSGGAGFPGGITFFSHWQACALSLAGAAYCWASTVSTPTAQTSFPAFTSISAGVLTTCAITAAGAAYCWGDNRAGQLGSGPTPSADGSVSGGLMFQSIGVGGFHACGITTTGAAYCWGYNNAGQLGNNTTTSANVPTAVLTSVKFSSIDAGGGQDLDVSLGNAARHTCAISTHGVLYCWGGNSSGQLGDGTTTNRLVPVPVRIP